MMIKKKIAIIGGGNLGTAIAEGLLNNPFLPNEIIVSKRNIATGKHLIDNGILVMANNAEAILEAKIIILAVKPFQINDVLMSLKPLLIPQEHILVSTATGVWIKDIQSMIGNNYPIVRAMPNTAISIKESMTCITHTNISDNDILLVKDIFSRLGEVICIEEKLMDAATVLGACGIAFAMRYIRANIQGGIEIGFSAQQANAIVTQTIKGATQLLIERHSHPEHEIDKVTTPMGCTITGLNEMEHQGFSSSLIKGLVKSYKKIVEEM